MTALLSFPNDATFISIRETFLKFGLLFFLFVAGLEVNLSRLKNRAKTVVWISLLGIAVPFSLGFFSVLYFPAYWPPFLKHSDVLGGFFLGTALSISALPVIARILMELKLIQTDFGTSIITAATFDDLIGWSLFAVLLSSSGVFEGWAFLRSLLTAAAFIAGILMVRVVIGKKIFEWLESRLTDHQSFMLVALLPVFLCAAFSEMLGFHAVFGAFLAGVALSGRSEKWEQAHRSISHFASNFFVPLYFVSLGLRANFLVHFDLQLVLIVIVIACVGKLGGVTLGARLSGLRWRESFSMGLAMNARGAMEMVLAAVALERGLIYEPMFVALIVMAFVTTLMSPVMQKTLPR
jgi:Kef-type K+ transport system membrane component KefB